MSKVSLSLDLSPIVVWPAFVPVVDDDGALAWQRVPMRFARPTAAQAKDYLERRARAARVAFDAIQAESRRFLVAVGDASAPAEPARTPESIQAEQRAIFDEDAELMAWWKGWKPGAVDGDPDSGVDRERFLAIQGFRDAVIKALDDLMAGGREKNSPASPGR